MPRTFIIALLSLVATLTTPAFADTPDDAKIASIGHTLDSLHKAASKADGDTYFALFAPDAVFI